jgi:cytochrome P450
MNKRNNNLALAAGALGLLGGFAVGKMLSPSRKSGEADAALPTASVLDTLGLALDVLAPTLARGVIIRRPKVEAMAERFDLDRRAVQRMQTLRDKYGPGPLMLPLPVRKQAVVFAPDHVRRVLDESPEPFATASSEKRAALSHFEPEGVLISHGQERAERRAFNEDVLDTQRAVHHLAQRFLPLVDEEAVRILRLARQKGELDWDTFAAGWYRLARRVVFGDAARDDQELNDMTVALRRAANWAFLHPKKKHTQARFFARIEHYLERAEPGSLAAVIARRANSPDTVPYQQVPQWLFAFDAAGMTTFRALALLATHPDEARQARDEIQANPGTGRQLLPFLRATVLESLRLWPTTPAILRQTTRATQWEHGSMPANTGVLLFAPFFHRDDGRLPYANRFTPAVWLEGRQDEWPLIPFSGGPATCPAKNLVLMLTSAMLAALMENGVPKLVSGNPINPARLPGALNNYSLRFAFQGQGSRA